MSPKSVGEDPLSEDEIVIEGYKLLGPETMIFAESILPLALEFWPPWDEDSESERPPSKDSAND